MTRRKALACRVKKPGKKQKDELVVEDKHNIEEQHEKEVGKKQVKCNMMAFHDTYKKVCEGLDVGEKADLLKKFKKTPFGELVEAYHKGLVTRSTAKKDECEMQRLIHCIQSSTRKFKFRRKLAALTVADTTHILGLPNDKLGLTMPSPAGILRKQLKILL